MKTINWMWFGNASQVNTKSDTPATQSEANRIVGYTASGQDQIKAVSVSGDTQEVVMDGARTTAFSTTYNVDSRNKDVPDSQMTYASPHSGQTVTSTITGYLSVRYQLTFPDGTTATHSGVLVQMKNGDMFFSPTQASLQEWDQVDALQSIKVLSAEPMNRSTYVATTSFKPAVHSMPITCFVSGTLIATETGARAVEGIRVGDLVMTRDNGLQPVLWIGRRDVTAAEIAANPAFAPVRIAAGALGAGLPAQDLLVSQQHRVLVRSAIAARMFGAEELLIAAKHLTEVDGIDIVTPGTGVTYLHLMFATHEILLSNGAQTESLYPGAQALRALGDVGEEIFALFPQLRETRDDFPGARPFAVGKKARQLALRHATNRKALIQ